MCDTVLMYIYIYIYSYIYIYNIYSCKYAPNRLIPMLQLTYIDTVNTYSATKLLKYVAT